MESNSRKKCLMKDKCNKNQNNISFVCFLCRLNKDVFGLIKLMVCESFH